MAKKSDIKILLSVIQNTRGVENISSVLGEDLGEKIKRLFVLCNKADKELDILHKCLTKLYEIDQAVPIIQKTLRKIENKIG